MFLAIGKILCRHNSILELYFKQPNQLETYTKLLYNIITGISFSVLHISLLRLPL
jgi:hypothetical protein